MFSEIRQSNSVPEFFGTQERYFSFISVIHFYRRHPMQRPSRRGPLHRHKHSLHMQTPDHFLWHKVFLHSSPQGQGHISLKHRSWRIPGPDAPVINAKCPYFLQRTRCWCSAYMLSKITLMPVSFYRLLTHISFSAFMSQLQHLSINYRKMSVNRQYT